MAIIDNFPIITTPQSGDELPIERGTTTYKIDYDALATAIIAKLGGDPVTIAHGGTGATTAATARAALGVTPDNIGAAARQQLSGVELDELTTPGFYYVEAATCTTSNETGVSANLIVACNNAKTRALQIRLGSGGTVLMWRSMSGTPARWNAWKTVSST